MANTRDKPGLPHVTWDSDGDLRLEWWKKDKKLTIYLGEEENWWIASPNSDYFKDGPLEAGTLQRLMGWLNKD